MYIYIYIYIYIYTYYVIRTLEIITVDCNTADSQLTLSCFLTGASWPFFREQGKQKQLGSAGNLVIVTIPNMLDSVT